MGSLSISRWLHYYLQHITSTVILVVLEFYANLSFFERCRVYFRNREVDISPIDLCEYYDIQFDEHDDIELMDLTSSCGVDMDAIMLYLTKNRGNGSVRKDRHGQSHLIVHYCPQ